MFFPFYFVLDWHGGMITRWPEREKELKKIADVVRLRGVALDGQKPK